MFAEPYILFASDEHVEGLGMKLGDTMVCR